METIDFDVYGRYKFATEEQCTHICLVGEVYSERDAMNKARIISNKVTWTSAFKHNSDD